jgi:hypothetical protein
MKKIAIFVEGQTEQIFVGKLIHQIYGYQGIQVISDKIHGKSLFIRLQEDPDADFVDYLFLVVNVDTDERVLSAMVDNAPRMADRGFCKIIGLRDLFPNARADKAAVINAIQNVISRQEQADLMKLILAIMEVEAWFLADPGLFERVDGQLTAEHIKAELGVDLEEDPEVAYAHPARVIKDIYGLVDLLYRKKAADTYKIADSIDYDTLCLDAQEKGKIDSFFRFVRELEQLDLPEEADADATKFSSSDG